MITLEYRCADGTPFPVEFESEEQAASQWYLERQHMTTPSTPLGDALARMGFPGAEHAYVESGLPVPSHWRAGPRASGFTYIRRPPAGELEATLAASLAASAGLVQKYRSAIGIWHDLCMPRTKEACARLGASTLDRPLVELAHDYAYAHAHTLVPVRVAHNDVRLLADVIRPVVGDAADMVANELTQGYENETLAADDECWQIAQAARASTNLTAALRSGDAAAAMAELRRQGIEKSFFERLDSFLSTYGRRSEEWQTSAPTWCELREGFWAQLRALSASDSRRPGEALAAAAVRREGLFLELDDALADDSTTQARFRRRYERARSYVAVREERALWQLIAVGCLRHAVLRRGASLVERGLLASADDVFYLLPDDLDGSGSERDLSERSREGRAEHERWKAATPPRWIGGDTSSDVERPQLPADGVLVGNAGSRGVATGRARVVTDLADAHKVEAGDVLVCVMTSPPWTPLFGLVSAVVVDTGGVGTHPAIAARDYGIPAVLGVEVGTAVIPDGAIVTVDGDKGTVTIR